MLNNSLFVPSMTLVVVRLISCSHPLNSAHILVDVFCGLIEAYCEPSLLSLDFFINFGVDFLLELLKFYIMLLESSLNRFDAIFDL